MWKWSLSNLRNYRDLGLEAMTQVTKTLRQGGWSPVRDLNWALTQCSARDMTWFCSHVIMGIVSWDILSPFPRCHKDMSVPTTLTGAKRVGGWARYESSPVVNTTYLIVCFYSSPWWHDTSFAPTWHSSAACSSCSACGHLLLEKLWERKRAHAGRNLYCVQCVHLIVALWGASERVATHFLWQELTWKFHCELPSFS